MDVKDKVLLQLLNKNKLRNGTKTFLETIFFCKVKFKKLEFSAPLIPPFRVSRVSGAHLCGFAPEPTLQRLQRWRIVSNMWEIWSAQVLNPTSPIPETNADR